MSNTDLKLSPVSPEQNRILAFFLLLVSLVTFISLIDYNPDDFHHSPMVNESPVLGKMGLFVARCCNGWFGLASWLLPWFFISLSIHYFKKSSVRTRIAQIISSLGCLLFISILANLRDFSSLLTNNSSLFNYSLRFFYLLLEEGLVLLEQRELHPLTGSLLV